MQRIRKSFRFPPSLRVKVGARIMLLTNYNVITGLVNGSLGIITGITIGDRPQIIAEFVTGNGTQNLTLTPTFEVHDGIILKQFPITLAYALSIHKVQGMTLSKLIVGGLQQFWQPQLLYVALSRVKTENDIKFLPNSFNGGRYTYSQIEDLFTRPLTEFQRFT
eukprot:NODE_448_length_7291_cov_0.696329.p4 type:complete len:164 gc:universal NODE_448_length_7291_cov_0.696329:6239-6730(+)